VDAEKRRKLIALLGMIGSVHDGEVLNAAKMAQRLLGSMGLSWEEAFGNSSGGESRSYQDGYNDGYRRGLAEGHATATVRPKPATWNGFARNLLRDYSDDMSDWENGFVESFVERGWSQPTPKQRAVFERIADKLDLDLPS
jgi:hypothetical protein